MEKSRPPETAKERATLTIAECMARAEKYVEQNGVCLLLMDVIGSTLFSEIRRIIKTSSRSLKISM